MMDGRRRSKSGSVPKPLAGSLNHPRFAKVTLTSSYRVGAVAKRRRGNPRIHAATVAKRTAAQNEVRAPA